MNKVFHFLIVTLILSSCINMNDPKDQARYISNLKLFNQNLINHFPKKLPNGYFERSMSSPNLIGEYEHCAGTHIKVKYISKSEFTGLKLKYSRQAKYRCKSSDSCLVVIKSHGDLLDSKYDLKLCDELVPIAQYAIDNVDSFDDQWKRQEDQDILILDWSLEDILDRDNRISKDEVPLGWEHGFSKGITLNEKNQTINYWLIIW